MNAKTATTGLYVAFVSLLTAVLRLLGAIVHLTTSSVTWLVRRIERGNPARFNPAAMQPPRQPATAPAPTLRLVAPSADVGPSPAAQRLTTALTGLGFRTPNVRHFVASLGLRVEREPIQELIKEGLRSLSPAATGS